MCLGLRVVAEQMFPDTKLHRRVSNLEFDAKCILHVRMNKERTTIDQDDLCMARFLPT